MSVWEESAGKGGISPGRRVGHTLDVVKGPFSGAIGVVIWGKGGASYHSDAMALQLKNCAWIKPKLHGHAVVSRWRHASHALMDRQAVLVTGGLDARGNAVMDPQLLDTSGGPNGPWHWCNVVSKGDLPAPRAGHTMTEFPGRPDSFLLYGGVAKGVALGDLHRIEIGRAAAAWDRPCQECDDVCEAATAEWIQEDPSGKPPAPRSGHTATIYERRLVLVGGENEKGLLDDCHVLDTGAMIWSTLGVSLPHPLSNHCAVSLPGVISSFCFSEPTLFIFGGRSVSQSQSARQTQPPTAETLDAAATECELVGGITLLHRDQSGHLVWRTGVAMHDSPEAREMSAVAFDDEPAHGRRIFLSGGQCDTKGLVILQDLHTCDISSADVRPRPRVQRVEPPTGLTTGGEELSIYGSGLDGSAAVVTFVTSGYRGQTKEVLGRLSGGVLRCFTPEWNQPKAGVAIYIAVDGGPSVKCDTTFTYREPPAPRPETPPPVPPAPAMEENLAGKLPPVAVEEQDKPAAPPPEEAVQADAEAHSPSPPPGRAPEDTRAAEPAAAVLKQAGPTWRKEGDGAIPFSYKIRRDREDAVVQVGGAGAQGVMKSTTAGKSTPQVGKANQAPLRVGIAAKALPSSAGAPRQRQPSGVSASSSSATSGAAGTAPGGLAAASGSTKAPAAQAAPVTSPKGRAGTSSTRAAGGPGAGWARTAAGKITGTGREGK